MDLEEADRFNDMQRRALTAERKLAEAEGQAPQSEQSQRLDREIVNQIDIQAYLMCAEMALSEARRAMGAAIHAKLAPFNDSAADVPVYVQIKQLSRDVHNLRRGTGE